MTASRLAESVRAGDLATARELLAARPELVHFDLSEHDEHRALHYAVLSGRPHMVRLLMDFGADPFKGIWSHRGATGARTLAADRGHDEIVAIIDEALAQRRREQARARPAPVPAFDESSPFVAELFAAFMRGDEPGIIALIEQRPEIIHWHAGDGWTPLHHASLLSLVDVVRWLLEHGADVNACEPSWWTPLELVGVYRKNHTPGKTALIASLLKEHGAAMTGGAAIVLGDTDWLRAAHAAGTLDVPQGYGLITRAVIRQRPDILKVLLDLGLDPDDRRRLGNLDEVVWSWGEPLRECVRCDSLECAELLLERGADPNPSIYAASSPMFEACKGDKREMIALLERHGGFADTLVIGYFGLVDKARQMLADEAAGRLKPGSGVDEGGSVAASLLTSGADGGQPGIVRLALSQLDWPPGDARWHWNLMRPLGAHAKPERDRYLSCFRLTLERSGPNPPAPYGRSILHDVCADWPRETTTAEERVALATLLLDAGARLDLRDDLLQSTPLGWACRWGRVELVRLFLARGADAKESGAPPWATPGAWAARMGHKEIQAVIKAAT